MLLNYLAIMLFKRLVKGIKQKRLWIELLRVSISLKCRLHFWNKNFIKDIELHLAHKIHKVESQNVESQNWNGIKKWNCQEDHMNLLIFGKRIITGEPQSDWFRSETPLGFSFRYLIDFYTKKIYKMAYRHNTSVLL